MISNRQFRKYIIQPACQAINAYSTDAEEILIATMAHESLGGKYLVQETAKGNRVKGGAIGFFQMQENCYTDVIAFIKRTPKHAKFMTDMKMSAWGYETMMHDLMYATIMARFNYLRFPEKLPPHNDIEAIWLYYKKYWNAGGKATREDFLKNYCSFVGRKPCK